MGVPPSPHQGHGRQRHPLRPQRAGRGNARRRRPAGRADHGREPQFQRQRRLPAAADLDGAARPQPPEHHPLVGVQRGVGPGHRDRGQDGPPHGQGRQGAGHHPAGDRGDERQHVHRRQRLPGGRRGRLQLPAGHLRPLPPGASDAADDQLGGHLGLYDPRRGGDRSGAACDRLLRQSRRFRRTGPAQGLEGHRRAAVRGRRVRLDRVRLSRRALAPLLAHGRRLLWPDGHVRLSQGGLLYPRSPLAARRAGPSPDPALDLAGARGPADQDHGPDQRRRSGPAAERQADLEAAGRSL